MAGKGGGAWKVAYADFVTAMMAFFMVMWITAQSNSVKQAVAKYFEHPYDASSRSPVPSKSASGASLIPLNRALDGAPPRSTVKGKSTLGGGMLTDEAPPDGSPVPKSGGIRKRSGFMLRDSAQSGMGAVIVFAENSTQLDEPARQILDDIIPAFRGKLNKIEIRGHASSGQPAGDDAAGAMWQLSYARCLATMKYLEQHGVEAKRIRLSQAGVYEPPPPEDDPQWREDDARVEVYMLGEYVDDYLGVRDRPAAPPDSASPNPEAAADASGAHAPSPEAAIKTKGAE